MHQIPDLDSLNPFKAQLESENIYFPVEKNIVQTTYATVDFYFGQRRERIDSEDFTLPIVSKTLMEADFFQQEMTNLKQSQSEELRPRRKSSIILVADPTLVELEV